MLKKEKCSPSGKNFFMVAQDALKCTFYFLKLQNFPGEVPLTSPSLTHRVCCLLKVFLPLLQIFGRPLLIPGNGVICGMRLLLVLILAPRVVPWVLWFSSLHKNQHVYFITSSKLFYVTWANKLHFTFLLHLHKQHLHFTLFYLYVLHLELY